MKIDYIIVGLGLAGLSFSRELEKNGKSYIIYEDNSQNSSIVAGGMYNPVILKRFTPVWNALEQLNLALPFYKDLEKKFNKNYDYSVDIYRIFKTIEEQNNWFIASDKPRLSNYMVSEILHEKYEGIQSNFGFGKLINTGRIDTKSLINDYRNYLLTMGLLKNESFNYEKLKLDQSNCTYEEFQATKVVFCEGFGLSTNPFFNYLPMKEAKGELLVIHAPKLKVDFLIKAAVFVMPLGNNYYKVGATFNWKDKSKNPTQEGKNELISKLESFLTVPYKIVEHVAGIRPTIKDRRPLLGKHPKHNNLAVFNGLGTRGVMIAPLAAKTLYNHLEKGVELGNDFTINRF